MQSFDLDSALIGTGTIFPNDVESRDWIGFHCTSAYYAAAIEANGFFNTKPLSVSDLIFVQSICTRSGVDASDISGFQALRTVSFSPIAELALCYSEQKFRGGQGLKFVNDAVNNILTSHSPSLSIDEKAKLGEISALIGTIQNSDAVIYAVDFEGLDLSKAHYDHITKTIKATVALAPHRIVAKLHVPGVVDTASIDRVAHRERLRQILLSQHSHFLKTMKA